MAEIKVLYVDMYKDFLSLVRKSRVGTVEPIEFAAFLNLAQEEVVTGMLSAFEMTKDLMDSLLPIQMSTNETAISGIVTKNTYVKGTLVYPENCRAIKRVYTLLSATEPEIRCNLIRSNEMTSILSGVFSKPSMTNCYYSTDKNNSVFVLNIYTPKQTYDTGYPKGVIEYYIQPVKITAANVVSSTDESIWGYDVCTSIVNTCARMYLENIQDARYQSFLNEVKQKH